MTQGEMYRAKASELHAKAAQETNPATRTQLEALALGYLRLAEQADRNAQTNLVYETPLKRPHDRPQQQQQQQQQKTPPDEAE
jgi:hypothetical protein